MKIGMDISQMAYANTGVANFTKDLIENILKIDRENEYVFFFSSLRKKLNFSYAPFLDTTNSDYKNFTIKQAKIPPLGLDFIWNRLHILPVENFIGKVDIFISSDWTQPPVKYGKNATILYDLIIYKYPEEMDKRIVETHQRRLAWVKKECDIIFCISESTKRDAMEILGIEESRLKIMYPGTM